MSLLNLKILFYSIIKRASFIYLEEYEKIEK